jgi:regulator of RNase E activity RraA
MDFSVLKNRLQDLDTACVCDADKSIRVMDPGIRPLFPDIKMIGTACTVRCRGDLLSVIKALDEAQQNEVLVIDGGGGTTALAGELFSHEAKRKGLAGIVLDGACRDSQKIRELRFPFYTRSVTPMAGTASTIFATQIDVLCGGVQVLPGDIVFGDSDGVVVLNINEAEALLDKASQVQETEEKVLARLEKGTSLLDMLNYREHYKKVGKGEKSKLGFKI